MIDASDRGPAYHAICWEGDWTSLPQTCTGIPEVWDQTIGCPVCGMNIWHMPTRGQWPTWSTAIPEPPADWWENHGEANPYDPYMALFDQIHAAAANTFVDADSPSWQGP